MKKLVVIALFILTSVLLAAPSVAQCSMCRSTVVNNVSNGEELGLAAGLNTGIIYLWMAPYALIGLMAFLWYRSAKANKARVSKTSF